MGVEKKEALISFAVAVFAYADCWFFHVVAHIMSIKEGILYKRSDGRPTGIESKSLDQNV